MNIQYVYTKKRNEFGRATHFSDRSAEILVEILPNLDLLKDFIYRNPIEIGIQNGIEYAEHEVNTNRSQTESKGIHHSEGGWPKDVNIQEQDQINRYRKKIEKDEFHLNSLQQLIQDLEIVIQQNNAIDIHQVYFQDKIEHHDEPFHARTVNLYSYQRNANAMVNHISWQTDGQRKIAVSYSDVNFNPRNNQIIESLVWDIENPNQPDIKLNPFSSLNTLEFNPKDSQQILAGCRNGQVCLFDIRKGTSPVEQSSIEASHRESVCNALWLQSKSGTECFSASTDGIIFWWDTKKMNEPIDKLILDIDKQGRSQYASAITTLEYDLTIPSKFLVGTETGRILLCTRKAKSDADRINAIYPGHAGPISSLQRHPFFSKMFLSASDWTVRIWSEEIRDDFILSTKSGKYFLTDAKWSPGRPAVFVSSTTDGSIHIWDLLFQQDEAVLSLKLSEESVTCLNFQEQGRYIACGTKNGIVTLIELSDSLCILDRNEKQLIASMFDREIRRTRLLESRSRFKQDRQLRTIITSSEQTLRNDLQQSTEQFWSIVNQEKIRLQDHLKHVDDPFNSN